MYIHVCIYVYMYIGMSPIFYSSTYLEVHLYETRNWQHATQSKSLLIWFYVSCDNSQCKIVVSCTYINRPIDLMYIECTYDATSNHRSVSRERFYVFTVQEHYVTRRNVAFTKSDPMSPDWTSPDPM
jgi:hypothetical protein